MISAESNITPGRTTVLSFPSRPTKVILGNRGVFAVEYVENDIFPPTDITEDWLLLLDYDPENVVKVSPIRPISGPRSKGVSAVV